MTSEIGLVKNSVQLALSFKALNIFSSNTSPNTIPMTSGPRGTPALVNKYPTIPNTNKIHISNVLLFKAKEPTAVSNKTVGINNDCGMSEILRSEEHTSELQSRGQLVCRLLLE